MIRSRCAGKELLLVERARQPRSQGLFLGLWAGRQGKGPGNEVADSIERPAEIKPKNGNVSALDVISSSDPALTTKKVAFHHEHPK